MATIEEVGSLQIGQDLKFQHLTWTVQRVGWILMLLLIVAALAGLFGRGPLSNAHAANDGLEVKYEQFMRVQAPAELNVRPLNGVASSSGLRLFISRKYLKHFQLDKVVPEPSTVELAGDYLIYTFDVAERRESGEVTFQFKPTSFGMITGEIGDNMDNLLLIEQVIYP